MRITDIFERKRVPGEEPSRRFRTLLKWRNGCCVVSAYGETQEAADEALLSIIRGRFQGSYTPLCLIFRGCTMLAWRDGDHWAYGYIRERPEPVATTICIEQTSREQIERQVRLSLAYYTWDEQEEASEIILDPDDQEKFASWVKLQKMQQAKYQGLLAAGWTRQEAYTILSGGRPNPTRIQSLGDPLQLMKEVECQFKPE